MAMLAVINKSVTPGPNELASPGSPSPSPSPSPSDDKANKLMNAADLLGDFSSSNPTSISINIGDVAALSYSSANASNASHLHHHIASLRSFAVEDGVYCFFMGILDNAGVVRREYGLSSKAKEESVVIEVYKTMRDRGPYPPHQLISQLSGTFAFLLIDSNSRTVLAASSITSNANEGSQIPFFWGKTADGCLAFSDDSTLLKKGCAKSYAPFPKGCFFSSTGGLQSYQHPNKKLEAVPRVDSEGQLCGATFKVDEVSKAATQGIPRVGSEANWASSF